MLQNKKSKLIFTHFHEAEHPPALETDFFFSQSFAQDPPLTARLVV